MERREWTRGPGKYRREKGEREGRIGKKGGGDRRGNGEERIEARERSGVKREGRRRNVEEKGAMGKKREMNDVLFYTYWSCVLCFHNLFSLKRRTSQRENKGRTIFCFRLSREEESGKRARRNEKVLSLECKTLSAGSGSVLPHENKDPSPGLQSRRIAKGGKRHE